MIDPNNIAAARLTFSDEFNSLSLRSSSGGTWDTNFWYNSTDSNGSSLAGNGEQEWYINANYAPTAAIKPWTAQDGILSLTAAPATPEIKPFINGYDYTSGEINTYHSFSQEYGYFEMRAELPAGQGFWPAFWLLPANGSWPPELDVMEVLGNDPTKLYTTLHYGSNNSTAAGSATVSDMSQGFHTYGVDWEPDTITWYFDGHKVFEAATTADMHQPMYMMANLALGGYWPGMVDQTTQLPKSMLIDYIRAYASDATTDISSTLGSVAGSVIGSAAASVGSLQGSDASETLSGTDGPDFIRGAGGDDVIYGAAGFDDINGNKGNDTIYGGEGNDWVVGGQDNDLLYGESGNDIVYGNLGNDTVSGGAGDDWVRGGQGDDMLSGGDGNDWLSGDIGSDTLTGGAGADTFHISAGAGIDLVTDFHFWEGDKVQLDAGSQFNLIQQGPDTVIDLYNGTGMTLTGVDLNSLGSGWLVGY